MNNKNITILGAGLSGLSAAYHGCGDIFEKESYVGGMCYSPKVDGFTFDLGIHVLHTKDEYVLKLILDDLKVKLTRQTRKAWIYSNGVYTRYPMQAYTYGLPIPIVKRCLIEFIKVCNSDKINFDNYETWLLSVFGEGFSREFLIPYSEKFWTVKASEMTTDWLDVRIPRPSLEDVIDGALSDKKKGFGPNANFMYTEGDHGIGLLPKSFAGVVIDKGSKIHLEKEAVNIDVKNKKISFKDGTFKTYDKLISTIPLPELVKIISPKLPDEVLTAANKLNFNSIMCVNLGINSPDINTNHWIYYPEAEFPFFRISFLKKFSKEMVPCAMSSITAEVSYSKDSDIDFGGIVDKVIDGLLLAKIIDSKKDVILKDVRFVKYGYVIYDHYRRKNLDIIKKALKGKDIIPAGRYGSFEYQWMDGAILDGIRASKEALGDL